MVEYSDSVAEFKISNQKSKDKSCVIAGMRGKESRERNVETASGDA